MNWLCVCAIAAGLLPAACGPTIGGDPPGTHGSQGSDGGGTTNGHETGPGSGTGSGAGDTPLDDTDSTSGEGGSAVYQAYGASTVEGLALRITRFVPSAGYCVALVVQTKDVNLPAPPEQLATVQTPDGWGLYLASVHGPASDCLYDSSETWTDVLAAHGELTWPGQWGCPIDVDVTVELPASSDWPTEVELLVTGLEVELQDGLMPCPE